MLPWLTAGDKGNIGVFWYGTDVIGDPNNQAVFANAKWKIFYAMVNTTLSKPAVQGSQLQHGYTSGQSRTGGVRRTDARSAWFDPYQLLRR